VPSRSDDLFAAAKEHAGRGLLEAAQAALAQLLHEEPHHLPALRLQGAVLSRRGQLHEALETFERALEIAPEDIPVLLRRGEVLAELERYPAALATFERVLALQPGLAAGHSGRARILVTLGRAAEGLEAAERALALEPGRAEALRQRGLALRDLNRPLEALEAFRAVGCGSTPGERSDNLADIGLALEALGRLDDALATYEEALEAAPTAPLARYRRGFVRLLRGDFAGGWPDYEMRWRRRYVPRDAVGHMTPALRQRLTLEPTPQALEGQRVLVVDEQGVGDVIMFASVLPDLMAVAAHVTCLVDHRLLNLFSVSFPGVEVVAGHGPALVDLTRIDRVVAIGSLPHAFRRSAGDFPGRAYLAARPAVVETWRARLGPPQGRLRVGISWRGGVAQTRTSARSMQLETLRPLLERDDCEAVSLQYGDVATEVAEFNRTLPRPILSFSPAEIGDFERLAGLVAVLDVVVTVQTTLAHLTGAVGQRGLVMIPSRPEWRYLAAGERMPWYRSVRLFRQREPGAWSEVIADVGAALSDTARAALPSRP